MKKRTKTLVLCISILVVAAASGFGMWYLLRDKAPVGNGNVLNVAWYHENGTEFTITTADELFEFAELSEYYDFKDQTIKLGADIVVNEGNAADWEIVLPERMWEPITGFSGTFDGQGYSISGLFGLGHFYAMRGPQTEYYTTGLFADTKSDCVIKNFKLLNSYFSSDLNEGVGSISSYGGGTFDSIYSDAIIVSYKSNNGGIVGVLKERTTITNCWYDGEIRVEGNVGRYTGGIVGRVTANNAKNEIKHCLNTANISTTTINRGVNSGGILGNVQAQARVNIEDCLTVGDITAVYTSCVGSFIGYVESSASVTVNNTYVKAESFDVVNPNNEGSMTGAALAHNEITMTGVDAYKWTLLDFEEYWTIVEDGTPILQSFADKVVSTEGLEKGFDTSWYNPVEGEYVIKTAEELYGLAMLSYQTNFSGKLVVLGNDIVLNEGKAEDFVKDESATRWIPISTFGYPFDGVFDGQGHSISGLYLNTCGNFGLFGETGSSSLVTNVKLENSYLKSFGQTIGSIVGRAAGVMQNVYSNAIVVGEKGNVGGMIGQVSKLKGLQISDCWFDGSVTNLGNERDKNKIGGIIGTVRSDCSVNNCLNTGTVDASIYDCDQSQTDSPIIVPIVGGLIGYVEKDMTLTIRDCLNVGKVLQNEVATAAFASVIGYVEGDVEAVNIYAARESCERHPLKKSVSGQVFPIDTSELIGYKAYQWTLLDFDKHWAVVKNGTPILKCFANEVPSVAGIKKEVDISWYSADKKTYVLDSREDLFGFRLMSYNTDFAEKTVKLGKDIVVNTGDAAAWANSKPRYTWSPIGTEKYPFKGVFDGAMHSVSGIYLKTDEQHAGFFSKIQPGVVIKNFKLENSYFESSALCFGSITGSGNGTFKNIYSNAIVVSSAGNAAGLIGQIVEDVEITNCWFDGSVTITGTGVPNRRAAGIVASAYSGKITISHCLNTGSISAPNYTGTNSATSSAVVPYVGGFVGDAHLEAEVFIKDSLNVGKVECNAAATTSFSSIAGYSEGMVTVSDTFATKESCIKPLRGKTTGHVTTFSEADISGYGGYQWMNLDFDQYWAVVISPTAKTPILKSFASSVPSLAGIERLIDTSWYTEDKTEYVLNNREDLNGFAYLSNSINFKGKTIKLGADIVMNTDVKNPVCKWDPIGSQNMAFAGTFDGGMHTISGLYVNTDEECAGLFAKTDKQATVKNLVLKDSYFESTAMNIGSIAGVGHGTFDTIKSEATVVGHNARVGGLIGLNQEQGTKLTNCWFAGTVINKGNGKGLRGTGGLVAVSYDSSELTILHCLNTGTVDASAYEYNQGTEASPMVVMYAGGLVGWVCKKVTLTLGDSLNTGNVIVSSKSADAKNNYLAYGSVVGYIDGKVVNSGKFYTTAESSPKQMNNYKDGLVTVSKKDIIGYGGYQWNRIDLNFKDIWTLVKDDTPILQAFANKIVDITKVEKMLDYSWKDKATGKANDPYMIMDVGDLYGLADLSKEDSFAGKYFKIGDDITVNSTGNATDWATTAPEYSWTSIGTKDTPFKGIIDGLDEETGKIHEIRGIYQKTTKRYGGFIEATQGATISNLKFTNCYFESTLAGNNADFAGLVAVAKGTTFNTIYSDAIVVAAGQRCGGFVADFGAGSTMTNCWFDGSVTNTKTDDVRTGGLVGSVTDNSANSISNCLNTGIINASKANTATVRVGGLVGHVASSAKLTLSCSLNDGTVSYNNATALYGSVIGASSAGATVSDTYATTESCAKQIGGSVNGSATAFARQYITGEAGYQWARLALDFKEVWVLVKDGIPVLQAFADLAGEVIDVSTVVQLLDYSWLDKATGEENDPYMIMDVGDLYALSDLSKENNFAGKYFKIGADITLNTGNATDWASSEPEYSWTSIGTKDIPFQGTIDGLDEETGKIHEIRGIYQKTATRYGGFIEATQGATISNLKFINCYFESTLEGNNADFAGLVAVAKGTTFNTIYSDAIVVAAGQRCGGFVADFGAGSTMTNCWFDGSVTNTKTTDIRTGGLVGSVTDKNSNNKIANCLNTGIINATHASGANLRIGGLVGHVASAGSMTMQYTLNTGAVIYNNATTSLYGSVGGDVGTRIAATAVFTTSDSCGQKGLTAAVAVGRAAIRGDAAKTKMSDFDFTNQKIWSVVPESTPVLTAFVDIVYDTSWYDAGKNEYVLKDKGDLYGFAVLSRQADYNGFAGKTIKLGADIIVNKGLSSVWSPSVVPNYVWIAIGSSNNPFAGTFDGANGNGGVYKISGLYLNTSSQRGGLFAQTAGTATVQNLKLENSYFNSTAHHFGSIAGIGKGTFQNIYSTATVSTSKGYAGGLIGNTGSSGDGVTIRNCWFGGTLKSSGTGDLRVGGVIGNVETGNCTISNCLNTGVVEFTSTDTTTPPQYLGGIVGRVSGTNVTTANTVIEKSLNVGTVQSASTASTYVDSLIGSSSVAVAKELYSTSATTAYGATQVSEENLKGDTAKTTLSVFDFENTWLVRENNTPILKLENEVASTSSVLQQSRVIQMISRFISEVTGIN